MFRLHFHFYVSVYKVLKKKFDKCTAVWIGTRLIHIPHKTPRYLKNAHRGWIYCDNLIMDTFVVKYMGQMDTADYSVKIQDTEFVFCS